MNRYKIRIVKKYDFKLSGNDKKEIENKVKTIMKEDLLKIQEAYNEDKTTINIKKIGKEKRK